MFKNLTSFGYQRSTKEAIGFYMAYIVLILIVGAVSAGTLGVAMQQNDSIDFGLRVGRVVAVIVSSGISFLILKEKQLF